MCKLTKIPIKGAIMSFYRYAYEIFDGNLSLSFRRTLLPISHSEIDPRNAFTYRYYTSEADYANANHCYVVSVGYERRPPKSHRHKDMKYNRYSFHYFVKGKGEYLGQPISAGQALIVPPFEELYFDSDPDDPIEFYYISVTGKGSEAIFENVGFEHAPRIYDCPFIEKIPELFYNPLFENHRDTDPSYYLISFFLRLMAFHKKYNVMGKELHKESAYHYYCQAICYIGSYLLSDITPNDVAKFLNISYSYLRKIFSEYCNCSVRDYILRKRFEYAADKLALTKCSVQQAAELIGYNDYVHFSKMFKKIIGVSPSQYKKEQ